MRQVQATLAREQKLAPYRGHGVKQMHRVARLAELLRSHQTGGAASHYNHREFNLHGSPVHCVEVRQRRARWQFFLYRS
jgi:hypothetical protein